VTTITPEWWLIFLKNIQGKDTDNAGGYGSLPNSILRKLLLIIQAAGKAGLKVDHAGSGLFSRWIKDNF